MRAKLKEVLRAYFHRLMQIRDTPHAIAGGVGLGFLFGFTPLFGVKTALALLLAWLLRCSKISAVLAVTFHDLFLPIWPVLLRWQYVVGYWILSNPHRLPGKIKLDHFHVDTLLQWKTLRVLWPTFLGSMVLGIPIALLAYVITLRIVTIYQTKRHLHDPQYKAKSADQGREDSSETPR